MTGLFLGGGGGGGGGDVLGEGVVCVNTMTFDYQHSIHLGKNPGGEGLSRRRNGGELQGMGKCRGLGPEGPEGPDVS